LKATAAFRTAETRGRDEEKQPLRLTLAYGVGKRDGEWCSLDYSIELASPHVTLEGYATGSSVEWTSWVCSTSITPMSRAGTKHSGPRRLPRACPV
jgi:hypothetical protein